jgi:hypothetical protein
MLGGNVCSWHEPEVPESAADFRLSRWSGRSDLRFEVTPEGDVVWEYVNPYFGGPPKAQTNQVFRVYRYTAEEIARAQAAT